ncbi:glutamate-rich protein 3 isoform X1 [Osmerus eperlanus]|uniref:glutamate-rich protein 3 isoform X1 n=1 Tax=Osmerus eperlanus TaxID=29151 RepID=UPI002E0D3614
MSHLNPGLLSAYNSLTDKHLTGYFNNTRIRRHLQRVGLITRSGRIVPDKEYRHKLIQRAHQRHVRECLAQAIFHKVLDMERVHQIEIKRKLEEFARRERVHKIKVERSKRYEEEVIHILSPRPPTGPRASHTQHSGPEGDHSESSESPGSSRPNTAPGKMQRPVRLKPIHSNSTTASHRRSSPYMHQDSSNDTDQRFNVIMDKDSKKHLTVTEFSRGISPYRLPVINNFVTPVPPSIKRKDRGLKGTPSGTLRGRRLRPTTAPCGPEESPMLRTTSVQSKVCVSMMFFGKTVHLSHDFIDMRDEVKVFQQHCGGENLCVYKGKLVEGETFQFVSRRHRGFPFSLTFFLNGLQVERLSSCCEFKHRKGSRLGGRHGHFGFSNVEGASPCYKCIIAMGLDKKPTPPPKRVKEDVGRDVATHQDTPKDAPEVEEEQAGGDPGCDPASSQPQDMETEIKEEITSEDQTKDGHRGVIHSLTDYEEDFEADEEGPVEDGEEKKDGKGPSPSLQKEEEEKEKHFQLDSEVEEKEEKRSRSASSSSTDSEESEVEAEAEEDQPAVQSKDPVDEEVVQEDPDESTTDRAAEKDEKSTEDATTNEETSPTPPQTTTSPTGEDTGTQDSPAHSPRRTEPELSDDSGPSETVCNGDEDAVGAVEESDTEKLVDESTKEEQDRAKSVQEKLAEAILKEAQCSSEPELSDTSTEEEEESADKTQLLGSTGGAAVTFTMKRQITQFEVKCEDTAEQSEQEVTLQSVLEEQGDIVAKQKTEDDEAESEQKTEEGSEKNEVLKMNPVIDDTEKEESKEIILDEAMGVQADEPAKASDVEDTTVKDQKEEEQETTEKADVQHEPEQKTVETTNWENSEFVAPEQESKTEVETAETADAEPEVKSEVEKIKAMPLVEPQATIHKQTSVTDTENQEDKQDMLGGTKTETIAENSSSSSEGSGDTTVHAEQTADTDENSKHALEEIKDEPEGGVEQVIKEDQKGTELTGEQEKTVELDTSDKLDEDETVNDNLINEEGIGVSEEENKGTDDVEVGDTEKSDIQDNEDKAGDAEMVRDEDPPFEGKVEEKVKDAEVAEDKDNPEGKGSEVGYPNEAFVEGADKVGDTEKVAEPGTDENKEEKNIEEGQVQGDKEVGDDRSCDGEEPDKDTVTKAEEILADDKKTENDEQASSSDNETEIKKGKEADMLQEKVEKTDKLREIKVEEGETRKDDQKSEISNKVLDLENIENEKPNEDKNDSENNGAEVKEESKDNQDKNDSEIQADRGEPATICEPQSEPQKEGTESTIHDGDDELETKVQQSNEPEATSGKFNEENVEHSGEAQAETQCEDIQVAQATHTLDFGEPLNAEDELNPESTAETSDLKETEVVKEAQESEKLQDEPEQKMYSDKSNGKTALEDEDKIEDRSIQDENDNTNVREVLVDSSVLQSQTSETPELESNLVPEAEAEHDPPCDTGSNTDKSNKRDESIEEASKPSEEGASIVHKPQAEIEQEEATDLNKESRVSDGEANVLEDVETQEHALTPETLDKEDHRDLVSNWVNMHRASKYFETFVEPLDDLNRVTSDDAVSQSNSNAILLESTNVSESPDRLRVIEQSVEDDVHYEKADIDHKAVHPKAQKENYSDTNIEVADKHSDIRSNNSKQDEPDETGPTEELKAEMEVTDLTPTSEAENKSREETATPAEDSQTPVQTKDDDKETSQKETELTDVSKNEVESLANNVEDDMGENQAEVGESKDQSVTDDQPATLEEITDLLALCKTEEEPQESRESPEPFSKPDLKDISRVSVDTKDLKESEEQENAEVTEVTDLTVTSGSKNGSQQDLQSVRHPDESGRVDSKDLELIGDLKDTLGKDELTTFSVEESSLFARTSYPLLTTAREESGY